MKLRSGNHAIIRRIPFGLFACLFLLCALSGCGRNETAVSRTDFCFDTVISLTLYGVSGERGEELADHCMEMAKRYDREVFSAHDAGSALWQADHAERGDLTIMEYLRETDADPELISLTETALSWHDRTEGAFSPTLGVLVDLWNIGGDPPGPVPSDEAVAEARSHTDPEDPGAMLDLGGIVKGYAADRMKEYLLQEGITSAVINLGGNVLLIGNKPDGSPFNVGIRDPEADGPDGGSADPLLTLSLSDRSVVTSGVYERFFEENGIRYHHILDPATGYPADSGLISVTILSADSASGDALSTACLVLGAEKGQALIESLPDTEALFITADGRQIRTAGFLINSTK